MVHSSRKRKTKYSECTECLISLFSHILDRIYVFRQEVVGKQKHKGSLEAFKEGCTQPYSGSNVHLSSRQKT